MVVGDTGVLSPTGKVVVGCDDAVVSGVDVIINAVAVKVSSGIVCVVAPGVVVDS